MKYRCDFGLVHSIYLVNIAKPFDEAERDRNSVINDFEIASKISFDAVNIHLGKYWTQSKLETFENMKKNIEYIFSKIWDTQVKFVFENTAWQGSEVWHRFDELGEFFEYLWKENSSRIFVCLDTAHAWWAWYDLNNWENILSEFDKYIGIDKLLCFHLNDAKVPNNSKLDRHANIGRWFVWLPTLQKVIIWANKNWRPLLLETPKSELWSEEIKMIKEIINWTFDISWFHQKYFQTEYLKKFEWLARGNSLF